MNKMFQGVCESIISRLERAKAGELMAPFECPWDGDPFPINMTTEASYRGLNILILWGAAMDKGYTTNKWATPRQLMTHAKKNGMTLNWKGQKATTCIRWVEWTPKHSEGVPLNPEDRVKRMTAKPFWLLNMDQVEGYPKDAPKVATDHGCIDADPAQIFINNIKGLDLQHGGDNAYFSPRNDYVRLPVANSFPELGDYHAVAFHELGHWTGHKSRLERDLTGKMGSSAYAFEEIVAEMTSAFFAAKFGLKGKLQHSEYIASYIRCLKDDLSLVRKAATLSGNAYDYLTQRSEGDTT